MNEETDTLTPENKPVAAAPTGSALTAEHYAILYHTENRAAGGLYCGGGKAMDELEALGLMQFIGRKSFVPDPYYGITAAGRKALRDRKKQNTVFNEHSFNAKAE